MEDIMAKVQKYIKKDGTTAFMFRAYLGIDPQTGKAKRTTRRGFTTEKQARLEMKQIEFKASQGQTVIHECNKTFQQVYEEWYQSYINTVRESTWNRTAGMFSNHILPALGKYRIRTITTAQCQTSLNKWYKQTTRNYKRWFNYVQSIFEYGIHQGYINNNPAKQVIMPKKHEKTGKELPNFWDKEQLKIFFNHIDPDKELEKYTLFRVLAFTGVRRGECLALTWGDLDIQKKTLSINKTLTQGIKGKQIIQATKTKKGTRTISIDSTTMYYLKLWKLEQRKSLLMLGFNATKKEQLMFVTKNNTFKSLNTPAKWLKKIINKSGLPKITVHGFRHSHASALFAAGATIKEVQERLGHEDAQTTLNIYTHVTQKQDQEAVQKLVNFLNF